MPSNHLILYCHLLLLPSIFPSIRVFSNESVIHIRLPKRWSFSFSISLSNEYLELISFRIDWFDLAVQGTVKSLLQHYSSKVSILQCWAFFIVHFSHPYMTTGKTIVLTRQHRSYPTSKVRAAAERSYPTSKVRNSGCRFAGAAVKRYPMSKVRETQIKW